MAKVRVSTLAKEFGMTSKELMGHLADMKIPAKSASSTLDAAALGANTFAFFTRNPRGGALPHRHIPSGRGYMVAEIQCVS